MKNKLLLAACLALLCLPLLSLSVNIRAYDHQGYTRIVFESDTSFQYNMDTTDEFIDLELEKKASVADNLQVPKHSPLIDRVVHRWEGKKSVFRVHMKSNYDVKRSFVLERPFRVVIDLVKGPGKVQAEAVKVEAVKMTPEKSQEKDADPPQEQDPEEPDPEKKKAHKLIDTICIDPGHGGTDLGAVGRSKVYEKDITLAVSKKLKRLIESKLGLNVVMTRATDEEVSLNSRVSKANNRKAQLFVSIHVNSSFRRSARGPETYYVSLKATDQEAFRLSQKENSSFEEIGKMTEDDDLKMILWNMAQTEYIKESSKLADFIQYELNVLLHTRNRGVKQAPFRVLMRAAMPAVLVEVAFVSNYAEEKKLKEDTFRASVAQAIYNGISKYIYFHDNMYK
jgi:N-acetylmuramoyl-L-alanine amidase